MRGLTWYFVLGFLPRVLEEEEKEEKICFIYPFFTNSRITPSTSSAVLEPPQTPAWISRFVTTKGAPSFTLFTKFTELVSQPAARRASARSGSAPISPKAALA